jgi:exonuclease SbcC
MSYGENLKPLSFDGIELACLTGANGVGKSSLLEAIAWSLWGKSRAKSDDDLVRSGRIEMWVDFEFELEGTKFRVVRRRSKKGKGQGTLEFMVDESFSLVKYERGQQRLNNEWKSLSGTSKAETQEKIIKTLRMSYETFVNSAFLRQGRADEFTVKKPQERKEVLSEILNLSYYDRLSEKTKEFMRNLDIKEDSLKQQLEFVKEEVRDKKVLDKEAREIESQINKFNKEIRSIEKYLKVHVEERDELEKDIERAKNLDEKLSSFQKEALEIDKEINERQGIIRNEKEFLKDEKEILNSYRILNEYKKRDEELDILKDKKFELKDKETKIKEKILNEKRKKEREKGEIIGKMNDYRGKISNKEKIEGEIKKLLEKVYKIEKKEQENKKIEEKIQIVNDKITENKSLLKQIKNLGLELNGKIRILNKDQGANCPLCKQKLDKDHKKRVKDEFSKEINSKRVEYKKIFEKNKELSKELLKLKEIDELFNKEVDKKSVIKARLSLSQEKLREIKILSQEIKILEKKSKDLDDKLRTGTFDYGDNKQLDGVINDLDKLRYDESEHKKVRRGIQELSHYEDLKFKLERSKERIGQEEMYIERLKNNKADREKEIGIFKEERENLRFDPEKINALNKDIEEKSKVLKELRSKIYDIQSKYGAVSEKIKRIKTLENEFRGRKKEIKSIISEKSVYDELAVAFGKKGIQAMIIEAAVPEIEEEANKLLSKMTDGKMQVRFLTQKEKKTDGELIETLDIMVEDETGVKSYEMFSGGEAYRINFAIRIALSKLLANRAGAKLQFLVVDEGFGTQDDVGRENLIEAINSISSDFKKILVITHIQELKDAFPIRIEVSKNDEGSNYEITG